MSRALRYSSEPTLLSRQIRDPKRVRATRTMLIGVYETAHGGNAADFECGNAVRRDKRCASVGLVRGKQANFRK